MAVAVVTSTAGGAFTYAVYTGTKQECIDQMASDKQGKPLYKVINMFEDGQATSVLVQYQS